VFEPQLRYAQRNSYGDYQQYKALAQPECASCRGQGTYYHCDAYRSSGVVVICKCVPEKKWWKWWREHQHIFAEIAFTILAILFWVWTGVLWWRWAHTLL
jgi:hypothetical protein